MTNELSQQRLIKINEVIKKLGIRFPNAELARVLDFSTTTVSRMLNGRLAITEPFWRAFISHYGVPDTNANTTSSTPLPDYELILHTQIAKMQVAYATLAKLLHGCQGEKSVAQWLSDLEEDATIVFETNMRERR